MIGGLILFFWRSPSRSPVILGSQTAASVDEAQNAADVAVDAERQRIFFLVMGKLGLGLIILGFALQVVASFPYLQFAE
jgi:hypothetical protein